MKRLGALVSLAGLAAAAAVSSAGAATAPVGAVHATPVGRMPFPERGYVLDLPRGAALDARRVRVTENGAPVASLTVRPLAGSGLRYGVVLALDASLSMAGSPFESALAAARGFVARQADGERIGLLEFNGTLHLLHRPTLDGGALRASLARPPALAYGTRILDALDESLRLIRAEKISSGAIVLLSDGADVGSTSSLTRVVAAARAAHVRVFTVGLRSRTFDGAALRAIAEATGGAYAEATSSAELGAVYAALGDRLATEFLLQYRSTVPPTTHVRVDISVSRVGATQASYTTPKLSGLLPFHRSLLSRFLLSWASLALLGVLVATLAGWTLHLLLERRRPRVVERVEAFVGRAGAEPRQEPRRRRPTPRIAAGSGRARGWLAALERDLEIARMDVSAGRAVLVSLATMLVVGIFLALISPVLSLLAALVPFAFRALLGQRLRKVRAAFAEQLPSNLQVLASALRAGHSFLGALSSAVESAHEPSRRELGRVVADERLGVPIEEAIRRVGVRMKNRDLEQLALLAELARTTGGNSAEVLDVVVATIRERADVRRLVRTLTAQGRMARWILSGLPAGTGLAFYAIQPDLMKPMLHSVVGQVFVVVAAAMVVAGSVVIQRIVDIEV